MVGAEGQEATSASSSHWESRLLQGHLHRRPDWALWKVGRGEGAGGGGKEGSQGLENKAHAIMRVLPLFSLVASFSAFKERWQNLGQRRNTLRHTKQCQDQKYVRCCFFRA